jgi:phage terminase large subunit-like protein
MRDFIPTYAPSPFTLLLSEIRQAIDHQEATTKSERANLAALWERINDDFAVKTLNLMIDEMDVMRKSLEAIATKTEAERRADARDRFADLKADIDASIAAGLIGGADGARLDDMIHRISRGLQEN